jgi:hypothetical protein
MIKQTAHSLQLTAVCATFPASILQYGMIGRTDPVTSNRGRHYAAPVRTFTPAVSCKKQLP